MFAFSANKILKNFNLKQLAGGLLQRYYQLRQDEGVKDTSWDTFKDSSQEMNLSVTDRLEDLLKLYATDVVKSYSSLTAGNLVVFEYTSLKQIKKSYFALIVGTKHGNGVYGNTNTKNDLMSCFLIDSGTDLNTMASVVNVLHSQRTKKVSKKYQTLENENLNRSIREESEISNEGMQAIFPTNEFRTFRLNLGMTTIYKLNLDG
jgi:hypothetical protein|tara:strand:+ start:6054 stop:6668 length:615 start_codon:yes stop_codon:yes gene_type:complete